MLTEIKSGKQTLALILDLSAAKQGTVPVTPESWPLQMLMMRRPKGHVVAKHMHKKIRKFSQLPQEALVIMKGAIKARIFDRKGKLVATKNVKAGQCLFLADGAHEVTFTKDSLVYAFKDGPHKDDKIFV